MPAGFPWLSYHGPRLVNVAVATAAFVATFVRLANVAVETNFFRRANGSAQPARFFFANVHAKVDISECIAANVVHV